MKWVPEKSFMNVECLIFNVELAEDVILITITPSKLNGKF